MFLSLKKTVPSCSISTDSTIRAGRGGAQLRWAVVLGSVPQLTSALKERACLSPSLLIPGSIRASLPFFSAIFQDGSDPADDALLPQAQLSL